jgi:surface polysaccharide O-acyltransferase-like enzyme
MKTILKWAAWLVSAFAILIMILGSIGYIFGNSQIFGVRWGTYYLFAGYFIPLAILLVVLEMSCRDKCKE